MSTAELWPAIGMDSGTLNYPSTVWKASSVETVGEYYCTSYCSCKVKDVACLQCGNIVGYHVCLPCRQCLLSCNNGHFWMFNSDAVSSFERLNSRGNEIQTWGTLPSAKGKDDLISDLTFFEECLR
ncbi:protein FAM72A-like isoform X3 [Liolophura sinensis]|uniref:protein FAM72A-like isoform X3 n=1 Tax=Liolophura sinensis TaxID=3198878 RepID=UPI003158CBC0